MIEPAIGPEAIVSGLDGSICDARSASVSVVDGHCRCLVCARCGHHTGNSHQGHYWAYCQVTRGKRDFHFCCPAPAGCELEATP